MIKLAFNLTIDCFIKDSTEKFAIGINQEEAIHWYHIPKLILGGIKILCKERKHKHREIM